ncbi:MAG: hypothetical protein KAV44_05460 [Bacteroidales bacterium]|nr:hypothetical protein [Bacteroidales bacterium]
MNLEFNTGLSLLFFTGIIISIFLCLLLILKKNRIKVDKILTIWMAVIAIHQLLFFLDHSGISYQYPHLLGLTLPIPILNGILLFCYVSGITKEKSVNLKTALPHLIPFLLLILLAIPFYSLPVEEKVIVFENEGKGFEWFLLLKNFLIVIVGLVYVIWLLALIYKCRSKVQNLFSNTDRKILQWLEYLSIGLGIIWLLAVFFDDWVIFSGIVTFVLLSGFFAQYCLCWNNNSKDEYYPTYSSPNIYSMQDRAT